MTSEALRLIDQFQRAHSGDPWHGSPVTEILKGVTHTQAAQRPPNGAHSIWELLLHATAWRNEVARRARGAPAQEPEAGDWPNVGDATPQRWTEALAALDEEGVDVLEIGLNRCTLDDVFLGLTGSATRAGAQPGGPR